MRVLAIDPGGTTGFAWWNSDHPDAFAAHMIKGHTEAIASCDDAFRAHLPHLHGEFTVVLEEFTITARTVSKGKDASLTLQTIGAIRYLAHTRSFPVVLQKPADAMSFVTDEKLKALGWYTPGLDHARDATRHLVLYLVRNRLVGAERLVVPSGDPEGGPHGTS